MHAAVLVCLGIANALRMWLNGVNNAVSTSIPDEYFGL
jgi:hypothetical protein